MALPGGGGGQPFLVQLGNAPYQFDVPVIWDPIPDDDFDRFEVYRAAELEIIGVSQPSKTFTIQGHFASWYKVGDQIIVTETNAGTYTVVATTQPAGLQQTDIEVAEAIPSATVDGTLTQALIQFMAYDGKASSFTDKLLPTGTYYYVVYAFDKLDNVSDPGDIIVKNSPYDINAPAIPKDLVARRDIKLNEVDLFWLANSEPDLKGYGIMRSFDGVNYDIIALTTKNSFTDKSIPFHEDGDSNTTPVIYSVFAYDKTFFVSGGSGLSVVLEMPNIIGIKGVIDYLSINVSWTKPLPEYLDNPASTEFDIYYKKITDPTYVLAGTVEYPISAFRIEDLDKATTYMVAINIRPHTGSVVYFQPEPIPITIPDYTEDNILPYSPVLEIIELDPENDRILLSWMRRIVDDDLLYYDVKWSSKWDVGYEDAANDALGIAGDVLEFFAVDDVILVEGSSGGGNNGERLVLAVLFTGGITWLYLDNVPSPTATGTIKNFITYATTKQNEAVFRNPRRSRTYGSPNYEMYFRIDAVDRSNNRNRGVEEEVKLMSQDIAPPEWYDQHQFTPQSGTLAPVERWNLMWSDAAQFMKYFRRYLIYESINWNGTYPVFTFNDQELRGTSFDNIFSIYNTPSVRGSTHASKTGKKWVVIAVEDWWGDVHVFDPGGGPPAYLWMELFE